MLAGSQLENRGCPLVTMLPSRMLHLFRAIPDPFFGSIRSLLHCVTRTPHCARVSTGQCGATMTYWLSRGRLTKMKYLWPLTLSVSPEDFFGRGRRQYCCPAISIATSLQSKGRYCCDKTKVSF